MTDFNRIDNENYSNSNNREFDLDVPDFLKKEKKILFLRYYEGKTQTEISEEVGISQAQVSRLEKNALRNIRLNIS